VAAVPEAAHDPAQRVTQLVEVALGNGSHVIKVID
jgi:hypothetical protein